jgi:hypothetical protein
MAVDQQQQTLSLLALIGAAALWVSHSSSRDGMSHIIDLDGAFNEMSRGECNRFDAARMPKVRMIYPPL